MLVREFEFVDGDDPRIVFWAAGRFTDWDGDRFDWDIGLLANWDVGRFEG